MGNNIIRRELVLGEIPFSLSALEVAVPDKASFGRMSPEDLQQCAAAAIEIARSVTRGMPPRLSAQVELIANLFAYETNILTGVLVSGMFDCSEYRQQNHMIICAAVALGFALGQEAATDPCPVTVATASPPET